MGDALSHLDSKALIQGVADGYLNMDLNARFIQNDKRPKIGTGSV